jgi:hypothetical protein
MAVAAPTAVFIALGLSKGATTKSMTVYGLLMAAYIAYLVAWYPRRMRRRLARCWETYELEIGNDYLIRRQADIPDLSLRFDDVKAVEHIPGRCLRVIGKSKGHIISIPEGIDRFGDVLRTISSVRPVRVRTIEEWQKYRAFMAAGLVLFVIMLWATTPIAVIPLSLAMGSVIIWVFFRIRRDPNIRASTKRITWTYWLFFMICLLKLFVAVNEIEWLRGSAIVGSVIVFFPCVLLVLGWMRWATDRSRRYWRRYVIAFALATSSISALLLYGVICYVKLAHIGASNEHQLAMGGVYAGCPLSLFSVVAATVGEGRSRVIVGLAGALLALVWSIAFFFA